MSDTEINDAGLRSDTNDDDNERHQAAIEESIRMNNVILSSGGARLVVSKAILIRESTFFRDMYSLPGNDELDESGNVKAPRPIDIGVSKESISLLYAAMFNNKPLHPQVQYGRKIATYIFYLSLPEKAVLREVADRFDCERIYEDVMAIFEQAIAYSPLQLLKRSSKANVVWTAKLAIANLGKCREWEPAQLGGDLSAEGWWEAISKLRPKWQLALTKLFWEGSRELLDRPKVKRQKVMGRARRRTREGVMQQSKRDYADMAREFDP